MFSKNERSSFAYWFAHWCAFQMTALNLRAWSPKYLFHDIEKPWMMAWYKLRRLGDAYSKVQSYHRTHHKHHLEYPGKKDYKALVIDWECSRFTKSASPLTAYEEYITKRGTINPNDCIGIEDALTDLGLWPASTR